MKKTLTGTILFVLLSSVRAFAGTAQTSLIQPAFQSSFTCTSISISSAVGAQSWNSGVTGMVATLVDGNTSTTSIIVWSSNVYISPQINWLPNASTNPVIVAALSNLLSSAYTVIDIQNQNQVGNIFCSDDLNSISTVAFNGSFEIESSIVGTSTIPIQDKQFSLNPGQPFYCVNDTQSKSIKAAVCKGK